MAGLGKKTFTAGEVLTAADVNGYLMDQTVMVFDDAAARTAAIGTPTEGMASYLKDTNALELYDGASWVGGGDITAVTAGTALTGGGSSGDVTLNYDFSSAAPFTASTATAYTIQNSDAGSFLQFTAAAGTVTIGTATAFTVGQQVQILADGTATIIAGDGVVTLSGAGTAGTAVTYTAGQYEAIGVVGLGSNAYRIIGASVVA